jgi:hypothetical protein
MEAITFMDLIDRSELKTLIEAPKGVCISMFMPTHRAGPEKLEENRIRLKNLIKEAKEQLAAEKPPGVNDGSSLLEPAQALLEDERFWTERSDGLALFLSSDFWRSYSLPLSFDESVLIGRHFYVKPIWPLFTGNGRFYILALSQKEVRLLQATRHTVDEVTWEEKPPGLAETLYDDPEKQLQFHTSTVTPGSGADAGKAGDRMAAFHGQGLVDEDKDKILRYFHRVDASLKELLSGKEAPLILAGVDYLLPIYQEANNYDNLLPKGVPGNPDELEAKELQQRAWQMIEPHFQKELEEAIVQYQELGGTDRISDDVSKVVAAAHYGQVDTLFVAVNQEQWGSFNPQTGEVELHQSAEPNDEELLDRAAAHTFLNSGTVYAVAVEEVPENIPLAAILRY